MRLKLTSAARWLTAVAACLFAGHVLAQSAPAKLAPAGSVQSAPVCAKCHEEQHDTTMLTAHGARNNADGSSCQSCHGDATEHLKAPSKNKISSVITSKDSTAEQKSAVCLSCHGTSRHLAFWQSGTHRKQDVTCVNCHSIHTGQTKGNFKNLQDKGFAAAPYTTTSRQLAYKVCISCHKDVRAEITKPSHHPIIEGKVACHDCHDPHGALTPAMLRAESYQDLCTSCHADKRGPWIHEHPPVMENCATCHTPHGSSHNRLLAQKPPALCADCHPGGHTHGIYDGRGTIPGVNPSNIRFEGSGCVNCHRQIHGSNAPTSAYGNFFLR
jgi:DmsE family decaheme c-type cytochrome